MTLLPCSVRIAAAAALVLAALGGAQAQGRLDAAYSISFAGIPVGKASWRAVIGGHDYTAAAAGQASGVVKVVASGEGMVSAAGAVRDGQLVAARYASSITRDEKHEVKMTLDDGRVTELLAQAPHPIPERVPLQETHKAGVTDPLTALLIGADGVVADACRRTLPVFDGRHRYDLMLAFKRMDRVKAERGYAGPVAVCAVTLKPIAGHRSNSRLTNFLAGGRDIELWLAPVAGTRQLAPFRASVASWMGNLVIQATHFDSAALPARRAAAE
jgi:hypothetical protein